MAQTGYGEQVIFIHRNDWTIMPECIATGVLVGIMLYINRKVIIEKLIMLWKYLTDEDCKSLNTFQPMGFVNWHTDKNNTIGVD